MAHESKMVLTEGGKFWSGTGLTDSLDEAVYYPDEDACRKARDALRKQGHKLFASSLMLFCPPAKRGRQDPPTVVLGVIDHTLPPITSAEVVDIFCNYFLSMDKDEP